MSIPNATLQAMIQAFNGFELTDGKYSAIPSCPSEKVDFP